VEMLLKINRMGRPSILLGLFRSSLRTLRALVRVLLVYRTRELLLMLVYFLLPPIGNNCRQFYTSVV
jgi:hypothetical protein